MATHKAKALPPLPQASLMTLSIDARAHRAALIRHLFTDVPDNSFPQGHRHACVIAIQDALDGFSDALVEGEWLAGIRRSKPGARTASKDSILVQLRGCLARPASADSVDCHLLLCLAPPAQDQAHDIACAFSAAKFILPSDARQIETSVLYGLQECRDQTRIVGGTFAFKGFSQHHRILAQILRVSIYIHLALFLEQHLLSDSHVNLIFPNLKGEDSDEEEDFEEEAGASQPHLPPRSPFIPLPPGILSFFSRKKHQGSLRRAQTVDQFPSGGSLDSTSNVKEDDEGPSSSDHGGGASFPAKLPSRWTRFSFTGLSGIEHRRRISLRRITPTTPTISPTSPTPPTSPSTSQKPPQSEGPFNAALNLLNASKSLLSTSVGVTFLPPSLLIDLAKKERENPNRRLKGDEKAALVGILGWTGTGAGFTGGIGGVVGKDGADRTRDGPGKGMTGLTGFVRQQGLQVLVSRHIPSKRKESTLQPPTRPSSALSMRSTTASTFTPTATDITSTPSTAPNNTPYTVYRELSSSSAELTNTVCCGRPRWHTYRYFSFSTNPNFLTSTCPLSYPPRPPLGPTSSPRIPSSSPQTLTVGGTADRMSWEGGQDKRLGEIIYELICDANSPCTATTTAAGGGCGYKNGEHELRIVHAGARISINVRGYEEFGHKEKGESNLDMDSEDKIEMWQSCRICQRQTDRVETSDGTFMYSYAKFLELLIYSTSIYELSPALCEHTISPPPPPTSPLQAETQPQTQKSTTSTAMPKHMPIIPQSHTNLIRHFSISKATVSFSISRVEDVFEVKVPRLQIRFGGSAEVDDDNYGGNERERMKMRIKAKAKAKEYEGEDEDEDEDEKKKVLRGEIRKWYKGVFNHLSKLEQVSVTLNADDDSISSTSTPTPSASSAVNIGKEKDDLPELPSSESGNDSGDERREVLEEVDNPTPKALNKELPAIHVGALEGDGDGKGSEKEIEGGDGGIDMRTSSGLKTFVEHDHHHSKDPSRLSDSTKTSSSNTTGTTDFQNLRTPTPSMLSLSSTLSSTAVYEDCLQKLRSAILRTEQTLYSQLQQARIETLNDVRRNFHSTAKGLMKRLRAWQKKHLLRLAVGNRSGKYRKDGEREKKLLIGLLKEFFDAEGTTTATMGLKELIEILPKCEEPEWWNSVCHVVPASNVIVREDDWGSLIAFTLSSMDYHRELANLTSNRPSISSPPIPAPVDSSSTGPTTSFFNTSKLFGGSSSPNYQLDPDRDDIIWQEPESYSAVISRKDHPRDHSNSILSIREVLRHKSPALTDYPGLGGGRPLTPPLTQHTYASGSSDTATTTSSVYAKPDVKVSMQAVGGEVSGGGGKSFNLAAVAAASAAAALAAERKMGKKGSSVSSERRDSSLGGVPQSGTGSNRAARASETTTTRGRQGTRGSSMMTMTTMSDLAQWSGPPPVSGSQASTTGSSYVVDTHIRRGKTESILSLIPQSEMNVAEDGTEERKVIKRAPAPPPKDRGLMGGKLLPPSFAAMKELPATPTSGPAIHQPTPSTTSITGAIANGLSMAMRYMLNHSSSDSLPSPFLTHPLPPTPPPVPKKLSQPHGLLLVDLNQIDERPHIKYDWTLGKRLKFSCTVYYAKQFELMRKRCGIDDTFLKSLERCIHWVAEGGKSKSNFWKTADEKFIIKTLVDAWNVADLQVLLELGPAYFRYVESTASRATILAKLVGFYTIEIRNLETGAVQSKADLLVMENLFYNRKINQTFDLKGIQGRKVKAKHSGKHQNSKTLFDGEWIEGQQKALILLQPRSKSILKEAIRSDADFLARSNIMDYSLLLGIDQEKKQIACGLVDTIGSYTFAKTLEYKAKHNLHSGKNVTVIPPAEYQERFVNTLEDYFVACPDKWSKPLDDSKNISDPFLLPSVL